MNKAKNQQKVALITGITGQDGSYLAEYLLGEGYEVWGVMRRTSLDPLMRIHQISDDRRVKLRYGNLRDGASLQRVLEEAKPDEIYNLAALSDVGISFKCPEEIKCSFCHRFCSIDLFGNKITACIPFDMYYMIKVAPRRHFRVF